MSHSSQRGTHRDHIETAFAYSRDRLRLICSILPSTVSCRENEHLQDLREQIEAIDLDQTPIAEVSTLAYTVANDLAATAEAWLEQGRTGYSAIGDIVHDMRSAARLAYAMTSEADIPASAPLEQALEPTAFAC